MSFNKRPGSIRRGTNNYFQEILNANFLICWFCISKIKSLPLHISKHSNFVLKILKCSKQPLWATQVFLSWSNWYISLSPSIPHDFGCVDEWKQISSGAKIDQQRLYLPKLQLKCNQIHRLISNKWNVDLCQFISTNVKTIK